MPTAVSEYLLREGSGTTAHNTGSSGGSAWDGTLSGVTWVALGVHNNGFGGINLPDAVLANDDTSITDFSFDAWVNPDFITTFNDILGFSSIQFGEDRGLFSGFALSSSGFLGEADSSVGLTASTWQHVAFVRSGTTMTIYVDGVSTGTGTSTALPVALASTHGSKWLHGFAGILGEARAYDVALSAADVAAIYAATGTAYTGGGGSLSITTSSPLPEGHLGVAYSDTLAASGSVTAWSITAGALPSGLSLNSSTGEISGTPTGAIGEATFTVHATDGTLTADATFSLTISYSLTIDGSLPMGGIGIDYVYYWLDPIGGTGPFTWVLTSGTLPAGITLDASGFLWGIPTVSGTFALTITVTDTDGLYAVFTADLGITPYPAWDTQQFTIYHEGNGPMAAAALVDGKVQAVGTRGAVHSLDYEARSEIFPAKQRTGPWIKLGTALFNQNPSVFGTPYDPPYAFPVPPPANINADSPRISEGHVVIGRKMYILHSWTALGYVFGVDYCGGIWEWDFDSESFTFYAAGHYNPLVPYESDPLISDYGGNYLTGTDPLRLYTFTTYLSQNTFANVMGAVMDPAVPNQWQRLRDDFVNLAFQGWAVGAQVGSSGLCHCFFSCEGASGTSFGNGDLLYSQMGYASGAYFNLTDPRRVAHVNCLSGDVPLADSWSFPAGGISNIVQVDGTMYLIAADITNVVCVSFPDADSPAFTKHTVAGGWFPGIYCGRAGLALTYYHGRFWALFSNTAANNLGTGGMYLGDGQMYYSTSADAVTWTAPVPVLRTPFSPVAPYVQPYGQITRIWPLTPISGPPEYPLYVMLQPGPFNDSYAYLTYLTEVPKVPLFYVEGAVPVDIGAYVC